MTDDLMYHFSQVKNWDNWHWLFYSKKQIHQVSCSLLMQTWCIIFLLEKNHCQWSQFASSKKNDTSGYQPSLDTNTFY